MWYGVSTVFGIVSKYYEVYDPDQSSNPNFVNRFLDLSLYISLVSLVSLLSLYNLGLGIGIIAATILVWRIS